MTDLNEIITEVRQAIDEVGEFCTELGRASMHGENAKRQLAATSQTTDLGIVTDLLAAAYEEMRQAGEFVSALIGISGFNVTQERLEAVSESGDIGAACGMLALAAEVSGVAVNVVSDFMTLYAKKSDVEISTMQTAVAKFLQQVEESLQDCLAASALLIGWYPFPLH